MDTRLLALAAELAGRQEPFVLATVVRRAAASSAQLGDVALIQADGSFHGWVGGSCTQSSVLLAARQVLADGQPRILVLSPEPPQSSARPSVVFAQMTCASGGSVDIYLDPVLPRPLLSVFGDSPVAAALVRIGAAMGYTTAVAAVPLTAAAESGRQFVVVATMGMNDEEALRAALALRPAYLGVVASAKRFGQMRETLLAQGIAAAELDRIHGPAGLRIGARTADEIAIAVLAEIVATERARPEPPPEAVAATAPSGEAQDPVCGMTVMTDRPHPTAEYQGTTVHFCCGGCRERFLASPESYPGPIAVGPGGRR